MLTGVSQRHGARRARRATVPAAPSAARRPRRRVSVASNVAVELWDHGDPLDSAAQRRARRAGRPRRRRLRRHQQRALRHVRHGARSPPRWPRCGPAAARRDRRLAAGAARHRTLCARAPSRPAASPATRAWSSARPSWAAPARSTSRSSRPTCRRSRARPATTRCQWLRRGHRAGRASGATAARRRARARRVRARSTTSSTLIEQLGFPGYFLIVWDIVEFCRRADIYCQGRGSAANSAVCYALGITNADAVDSRPALRAVPVTRA